MVRVRINGRGFFLQYFGLLFHSLCAPLLCASIENFGARRMISLPLPRFRLFRLFQDGCIYWAALFGCLSSGNGKWWGFLVYRPLFSWLAISLFYWAFFLLDDNSFYIFERWKIRGVKWNSLSKKCVGTLQLSKQGFLRLARLRAVAANR